MRAFACGTLSACAPSALAGPWPQNHGAWQQTTTASYERGDFGVAGRQDFYLEGGVTPKLTLTLKLENLIRVREDADDRTAGALGLNRGLWRTDKMSISAGGAVLFGENLLGENCSGAGGEARIGVGRNVSILGRPGFAAAEGAYRSYGPDCARQKLDVVVGVDPARKWRVFTKLFAETGDDAQSLKGELQITRDILGFALGAGYRREFGGDFSEDAYLVSVQRSF